MRDPMTDPPDELNDLLAPKPATESVAFRDALFARTVRRLAWARWARRATTAAAVVAVFGAGGAIGWLVKPDRGAVQPDAPEAVFVFVPVTVPTEPPVPDNPRPPKPPVADAPGSPASDVELRAEQTDDRAEAARLYRLAGDKYLDDRQDYVNATRCYRLYLMRAGDSGLSPESGDTWLLTSLKNAAFREKANVSKTDG